jgi:hypothetical protein
MDSSCKGKVTKTITAQNTFSDAIRIFGPFNFTFSGINGDTVVLQRSYDGITWYTVKSYTADDTDTGSEPERGVQYRFGVATGAYSAGTIIGRISF